MHKWRGSDQVSSKCATYTWGLYWAEGTQDYRAKRNVLLLNYLEESKLGIFPGIKSHYQMYILSDPSVWQCKHLITKYLLFLTALWVIPLPFEAPGPSLAQVGIYTPFYLSGFELLTYVGLLYRQNYIVFPSVNLFRINLILSLAKKVEENFFLPYIILSWFLSLKANLFGKELL